MNLRYLSVISVWTVLFVQVRQALLCERLYFGFHKLLNAHLHVHESNSAIKSYLHRKPVSTQDTHIYIYIYTTHLYPYCITALLEKGTHSMICPSLDLVENGLEKVIKTQNWDPCKQPIKFGSIKVMICCLSSLNSFLFPVRENDSGYTLVSNSLSIQPHVLCCCMLRCLFLLFRR